MHIPRVTEVLRIFGNYSSVPPKILQKSGVRGTAVHRLCAGIALGNWIPESMIEEDLVGYVRSFKQWADAQISKFTIIESRYFDRSLKYSGEVDFVAIGRDDKSYLIDIKTCLKKEKTHPLQIAAYRNLLFINRIYVEGAMLVYLNKHGEFPDIEVFEDLGREFQVFVGALNCWHYYHRDKERLYRDATDESINESGADENDDISEDPRGNG